MIHAIIFITGSALYADYPIAVRARGTSGGEILELRIDGNLVDSWTMTTSYQDYNASGTGVIELHFINDDQLQNGMDIQVDYIIYNGTTYQAEDQEINTAVYDQDSGSCGGSYSEMMECNGYIRFDTGSVVTGTLGDVNSDGTIDILDALLVAQSYVGLNPQNFDSTRADVDCSGDIDIVDALLIAQLYVGLITGFPCPTPEPGTPEPGTPEPTGVCDPNAPTPKPVSVSSQGAPFTGSHQVVVEQDPTLPEYTVYRPADLGNGKYPIIAWGEGACSRNGLAYAEFLAEFASHGYLVIADGEPNGSGTSSDDGAALLVAIDWAIAENQRQCSQYYQNLDPARIVVMGHSCGGLMAMHVSGDPRISTVILWNSGLFNREQNVYNALHTPIAIVDGGPDDMAYENGLNDYNAINTVPIIFANIPVGHGGTYSQDNGGEYARFGIAWLRWHLSGDEGATGKGMFVGTNCGFCNTNWDLQSKNLQ